MKVLFICTHNSARSQMAEAFVNNLGGKYQAQSAGTNPTEVRPEAVTVMRELGIDISDAITKDVKDLDLSQFDIVVTVCEKARQECLIFQGVKRQMHMGFSDPELFKGAGDEVLKQFRALRNEILGWVTAFFNR